MGNSDHGTTHMARGVVVARGGGVENVRWKKPLVPGDVLVSFPPPTLEHSTP